VKRKVSTSPKGVKKRGRQKRLNNYTSTGIERRVIKNRGLPEVVGSKQGRLTGNSCRPWKREEREKKRRKKYIFTELADSHEVGNVQPKELKKASQQRALYQKKEKEKGEERGRSNDT